MYIKAKYLTSELTKAYVKMTKEILTGFGVVITKEIKAQIDACTTQKELDRLKMKLIDKRIHYVG